MSPVFHLGEASTGFFGQHAESAWIAALSLFFVAIWKSYTDANVVRMKAALDQKAEERKSARENESAIEGAFITANAALLERQKDEIVELRKYQRQLETDLRHCSERHIRMTAFCSDLNALAFRQQKQIRDDWHLIVKVDPTREPPRFPDVPPMPDDFDQPKPSGQRMAPQTPEP